MTTESRDREHTWTEAGPVLLRDDERIDDLERNGYGIIQRKGAFCFGMDAVLLSGFAVVKPGETALDLGTGTGIIPILLEAKTPGRHFTGLEIQEESADMARRSVAYNRLEEKVEIVTGDIKEAGRLFKLASFDVVTSNPPYMNSAHGLKNPGDAKAIARHEVLCTLEDVIREGAKVLRPMAFLHGSQAQAAGGDSGYLHPPRAGAEADEIRPPLRGPGGQHGAHRGGARGRGPDEGGVPGGGI